MILIKKFCFVIFTLLIILLIVGCTSQSSNGSNSQNNVEVNSIMTTNYTIDDVTLNSGYKMPVLGLGTWTLSDSESETCVYEAIKVGYRLIDTARYYGNEVGVGRGVRKAIDDGIVKREEIFVTSKIMLSNYNSPDKAIDDSINALNIGYIDLMLIHQPGYRDEEVYKALERAVKAGKVHSIGISNYYTPQDFERINKIAEIVPAVVQNENHPFYQNTELQNYLKQYGTVVESWYPFGGRGNTKDLFNNETIKQIAAAYNKTSAQIILRWHLQAGYITVPGSKNLAHIAENFNIFDFELTESEMQAMAKLNKKRRFENW